MVARRCGADRGRASSSTDRSEAAGDTAAPGHGPGPRPVVFTASWPATSEAATGRKASSSSLSVSTSLSGMSEDDSEGDLFLVMGRLTSGTTSSSVLGLGRLLM